MAQAPSCFVNVSEPINQPLGPAYPNIPPATDLSSALQALDAMRQAWNIFLGNVGGRNNLEENSSLNTGQGKQGVGRWRETSRAVAEVTMMSTDGSVTFTFDQINQLVFTNLVTGEKFVWNR